MARKKINEEQEMADEDVNIDMKSIKKTKETSVTNLPGVGPATAEKLAAAGFDTLLAIAVGSIGEIVEASGVSEVVARKIIQAARASMDMGFMSGEEVMQKRLEVFKIETFCEPIDAMLEGGFETRAITECFGQYGSGKTQIGHLLACTIQKKDPTAVVVYIDTESTFRPERIVQFANGLGLNPDKVLKNIKVARAYNSDHQMLMAEKVEELIKEGLNVKLIIVDSLTAHFRAEFVGRGTLAGRQQKINKHMHVLAKLADMYNLGIYVTNQVMARPDTFFGDPTEAIGGHIVGHNSTFRIYLRKGRKGSRVAKLVDAPNIADKECAFMVKEEGLFAVE